MSATTDSLAVQIDAIKQGAAAHLPPAIGAIFGAEQAALTAAGVPDGVATPGALMPDGELLDVHGAPTSLSAARAGRPAVIVLYRGAWCPYCNATLRAYQAQLAGVLDRRGVALIAISPQAPDGSLTMREKSELSYDVVSDPGNQIARGLGVLFEPGADTVAAQGELGLTVAEHNADGTGALPMPTVAIADASGMLRWIDVHPDYTTRTEPAVILAAIDRVFGT
jgi:peroxiredoxin